MTNPVIDSYWAKRWYDENGRYHREDGPAVEWWDGDKWWRRHGKRHRTDGPAGEMYEEWYVNDKQIDIKPILERLDISPDWKTWTDEEKFLVKLAIS